MCVCVEEKAVEQSDYFIRLNSQSKAHNGAHHLLLLIALNKLTLFGKKTCLFYTAFKILFFIIYLLLALKFWEKNVLMIEFSD